MRDHGPHKTTERSVFGKFARKPSTASASGKSCRGGRNPATKDVQHGSESAPRPWTALQRPATPARARVDVLNETAKDCHSSGDSRERPAAWDSGVWSPIRLLRLETVGPIPACPTIRQSRGWCSGSGSPCPGGQIGNAPIPRQAPFVGHPGETGPRRAESRYHRRPVRRTA